MPEVRVCVFMQKLLTSEHFKNNVSAQRLWLYNRDPTDEWYELLMVSEEDHNRAISHRQTDALCLTGETVKPPSLTMGDYEDEKQEE